MGSNEFKVSILHLDVFVYYNRGYFFVMNDILTSYSSIDLVPDIVKFIYLISAPLCNDCKRLNEVYVDQLISIFV